MIWLNRSDILKLLDHALTGGRHWRAKELHQFNRKGPVIKVGSRSFCIHHERSPDPAEMFPRLGFQTCILVEERLRSRLANNLFGRSAATEEAFIAALEAHIANQRGWYSIAKVRPVARDVKSVLEHADIFKLFYVSLDGFSEGAS